MRSSRPFLLLALCSVVSHARAADPPGEIIARTFLLPKGANFEAPPTTNEPPFSLTASDGTGLRVVSVEAHAVVEEPLAFTELQLRFQNPQDRLIEGQFRIALPQNATVSRFAMRINDTWQEGEVVEKQAARRAYEDFLHRRQDPALLEQGAANEFSARVFPIPARGTKDIILSYSQELVRDDDPYRIPLHGLPELGSLRIQVLVGKTSAGAATSSLGGAVAQNQVVEVSKSNWKPDRDFEVAQFHVPDRLGLRHDNLVVARITPVMEAAPDPITSMMLLIDTSASRALGFNKQAALVEKLLKAFRGGAGATTPLVVACFDQAVETLYDGRAGDFGHNELQRLRSRRALGASDLAGALRYVADYSTSHKGRRFARVVVLMDGVATAGPTDAEKLREVAARLKSAEVDRIDAIAVGGIRDEATLRRLVTAGLPHDGTVIDGDAPLARIARKLTQATRSGIKVAVEGAGWTWPQQLDGVQPGDQVLVYADLPAAKPFTMTLSGTPMRVDRRVLSAVEQPLLERAWVAARIARIMQQRETTQGDNDLREALKKQATELSIRYRVLSPFTALLVLETENDYARYGIDRKALADILTVGPTGITLVNRKEIVVARPETPPPTAWLDRFGPEGKGGKKDGNKQAEERARKADEAAERKLADEEPAAKRKTVIDFSDDTIEGDLVKPEGSYIVNRPKARRDSMVPGVVEGLRPQTAAPPAEAPATANGDVDRGPRASGGQAMAPSPQTEREPPRPAPRPERRPSPEPMPQSPPPVSAPPPSRTGLPVDGADPYAGAFSEVMASIKRGDAKGALQRAWRWRDTDAGDVMALIGLGEAAEAVGDVRTAARAYGSLIDLFPNRADMRRFAGERLERLKGRDALDLVVDTYEKAREERPDHPASHRLYAYALVRAGRVADAFEAICASRKQQYRTDSFRGVDDILAEDIGLIGAAWMKAEPRRTSDIQARIAACGGIEESRPPDMPGPSTTSRRPKTIPRLAL